MVCSVTIIGYRCFIVSSRKRKENDIFISLVMARLGLMAQSSEEATFTSEIVASILATHDTYIRKESVNALPKVVGFRRVLWFSNTGNIDRVGWD